ncbi:putative lipid II flippase FtsW [Candidatus Gottesmanbacteria bacterium]|nr:putative lipid II flippase FtsW [Candidatus Gottesmanbacteria bacterium]
MKYLFSKIKKIFTKKEILRKPKARLHRVDAFLVLIILTLAGIGILMVYNASVAIAIRDFSDQYYFVREQIKWLGIGIVSLIVFSSIDYHRWYKLSLPLLIGALVLLLAVFIPGLGVRALGAHRWLNFGFFVVQPAEITKLILIMYLSAWFSLKEKGRLGAFLLLLGMVVGLIIAQPNLGTAVIIICIAILLYFLSGAPVWQFIVLIPLFIIGAGGLAVAAPYRFKRLTTFFDPESDPLGASYQIRQILLAFGSGGWFGVGIGKSRQKYEYLPEANTDSIFAIIGEELGFIGAAIIIGLFLLLVWRGFRIAKHAPDSFGRLLALGISSWVAIQTIINLSAMVALIPLTGVPLPLVSYGGSSLIILLSGLGILLNISRH